MTPLEPVSSAANELRGLGHTAAPAHELPGVGRRASWASVKQRLATPNQWPVSGAEGVPCNMLTHPIWPEFDRPHVLK